jgi:hypothetical protein
VNILPDGYYVGGSILLVMADGMTEQRAIESRAGNTLTLLSGTSGLTVGQAVKVYPGCNQTSEMCDAVYNNILNYGGFRHMPGKSPFDAMLFY